MKKLIALVLASIMAFGLVACGGGSKGPKISVFWYDESDVYLSSVRTALNAELDKLNIPYDNQFAANDQAKQLDQVKTAIAGGS
ncbi:MAG: galactose ABC transporter substrate-binding protein, partial [Oscillospiraceae bacterium]|nr:galactose ABC transporter substrate-binding protein [Oscillospiraceae bacterium]